MSHQSQYSSGKNLKDQFALDAFDETHAVYGFEPVSSREILEFHRLANELIEGEIASPAAIAKVQFWTKRSLHIRRNNGVAEAFIASIPLTLEGRIALLDGRFDFANAKKSWVCPLGGETAAILNWGIGGRTPKSQAAAVRSMLATWKQYPGIPAYARGRSEQGKKLLTRLGFKICGDRDTSSPLFGKDTPPKQMATMRSSNALPFNTREKA